MKLSLIVAASENDVIGREGDLPWRLSADLQRFKRITMGHVLIMGRKTWESIGRPLPGRTSIVISRQPDYATGFDEVLVATNLEQALSLAREIEGESGEAFVIGGAGIYNLALPNIQRLLLTRVQAEVQGDVCLPSIDWSEWQLVEEQPHPADERNQYSHIYQMYERTI